MKITMLAAVSALALFAALPATAADLLASPPPVVAEPAADWSGVYVGAHVGYGFAGMNEVDDEEYGYDPAGLLAGVQIGARQQFDNFVLGVQGDISWSGQKGVYRWNGGHDDTDTLAINWQGSLTGRAGVALDNALLYGLAGLTVATTTADYWTPEAHATLYGGTIGVGAELKLSDGWSAFGEYSYTKFADFDASGDGYKLNGSAHAVKVGLNYSF